MSARQCVNCTNPAGPDGVCYVCRGERDVLAVRAAEILRAPLSDRENLAIRIARMERRVAAVAELIAADDQLIEMCDELVRVNNKTLGRGAVRIQAAIIDRFLRKVERSRAALARCKGGAA